MSDIHVVILAAGKGTRLKSSIPKVLHRVAGLPMLAHVLRAAKAIHPTSLTLVVGHQADLVKSAVREHSGLTFVVQEPQLGTGHALLTAETALKGAQGTLLLLSGDVPLLSPQTLQALADRHRASGAAATVLTALVDAPEGYGRIVRSGEHIARIVEDRDASPAEREVREINAGIYAFALDGLFDALRAVGSENAQREYYLPDLVAILHGSGRRVDAMTVADPNEVLGINSRAELAEVSRIMRQRKNAALMESGVTIEDPATTYVSDEVTIGADTILHPGVTLEGKTEIGSSCEIHSGVRLVDTRVGDRVTILNHCVITACTIGNDCILGPFAHLRPAAELKDRARVGNFVELKRTVLGSGTKAMHLSYLGDATIGEKVNIGAGTITCNYDGVSKSETVIEDGAFIGSDSQLVAPVTIKQGAYVGSGTTVREDVPPRSLAVSAGKQRNIEGWVDKKKKGTRG